MSATLPVLAGPRERARDETGGGSPRGRVRYERGMNFAAVLRESQGVRGDLPAPPRFDRPAADLTERAHRALYEVSDPEFPISVVDLGLIYGVQADEASGEVTVRLSFTATACPCMDFIEWDVRERLLREPGVSSVTIDVVWDPPWTTARITERGRGILRATGIAV